MASYSKAIIVGNLVRDVDSKQSSKGTTIANITLAVNSSYFDKTTNAKKEEVSYIDVTLFGKLAELADQYLAKGKSCLISGRLKTESWSDKQTGQQRSKLVVIAEEMQILGGKGDGSGEQRQRTPIPGKGQDFNPNDAFPTDNDDVPF